MDFKTQKRLITFVTAAFPSLEENEDIIRSLHRDGSDIVEIGIPCSNPYCDGPVIKRSTKKSLMAGTDVTTVLNLTKNLSKDVPIVIMSYREPLSKYGLKNFIRDSISYGAWGILIVDMAPDEEDLLVNITEGTDTNPIFIVSPEDDEKRLTKLSKVARGFLYCRSSMERTGTDDLYQDLEGYMKRLRRHFSIPLALGFGIDGPEKASSLSKLADGVIVGTAIMKRLEKGPYEDLSPFVRSLKEAL